MPVIDQDRFDDNDAFLEQSEGEIEFDHYELARRLLRRSTDGLVTKFWVDEQGVYHLAWRPMDTAWRGVSIVQVAES